MRLNVMSCTCSCSKQPSKEEKGSWKLTLPCSKETLEINKTIEPYYIINGDEIVFKCESNKGTTPNTKYSRCEYREMNKDGSKASWTMNDDKELKFSFKLVEKPEKRPRIVVGQIHDSKDDVIELLIDFTKGKPFYEVMHNTTHYGNIVDDFQLNKWYDVSIKVVKNKIISTCEKTITVESKAKGCYFKVGNYLQSREKGDKATVVVKNILLK